MLTRPCFLHEVDAATPTPPVCVKTRLWLLSVRYVSPEPVLINHRATVHKQSTRETKPLGHTRTMSTMLQAIPPSQPGSRLTSRRALAGWRPRRADRTPDGRSDQRTRAARRHLH